MTRISASRSPRRRLQLSMLLVSVLLAGSAWAGSGVAPKKPSDLVMLDATLGFGDPQPPCPSGSRLVNVRVLQDGSTTPFSIPEKEVLVLTAANFYAEQGVAGLDYEFHVFVPNASGLVVAHARADSAGQAIADVTIPNGVVVKPGVALCANAGNLSATAIPSFVRLYGFFAKDQ